MRDTVPKQSAAQSSASVLGDAELLRAARARIAELCERHGIIEPTVSLALRGRCAGRAHTKRNHMSLNTVLFRENFAAFIDNTIPHELCHLWKHQLGLKGRPHGDEWKRLMQRMNVEPSRCHCYDTARASTRRVRRFTYYCACKSHSVTTILHNRMRRGRTYNCTKCKTKLQPRRES
ncbi:MAG: SprT-like domain-containing protein [Pyrinomonadaceae bacterium]|nr:SprT-like domain-containing protein [Pyrinomonadaceae bacterium]